MRFLEKLQGLYGTEETPPEMAYECAVCSREFETKRTACPNCGGQVRPI